VQQRQPQHGRRQRDPRLDRDRAEVTVLSHSGSRSAWRWAAVTKSPPAPGSPASD
jgi:hypothetical protein